ncbi:helix-turn-helix domain-containing protein [Mycolicibacterium goodii]|uniref:helix-turn-helix domain-containing protein n=1 Tax=Mycolicibacterium goodii TaxID=134601 RepID=UPI001BDC27ED|nr:helix-turn-helix domain-containing protein [Mycolicibacterium goodii]MBU8834147.1 helix-turn-helix domain-containing protein [Mycolicibacterium goodii]
MPLTMSLEEAAAEIGAPSANWLAKMIRANRVPARKIGRSWRMTRDDIESALENLRNGAPTGGHTASETQQPPATQFDTDGPAPVLLSFTATSRRRTSA